MWKPTRSHPRMPCRIMSSQGKILSRSQGGKGMCRKKPILQERFSSSAVWRMVLAASIRW